MNVVLTHYVRGGMDYLLVASLAAALMIPMTWAVIKLAKIKAPIYGHQVWLFCLIGSVLLPALYLYGPRLSLAVLPAPTDRPAAIATPAEVQSAPLVSAPEMPADVRLPSEPDSTVPGVPAPTPPRQRISAQAMLASLWLVGFSLMVLRLFVGWYRLRQIFLSAVAVSDGQQWGGRKVHLRLSSQIQGPVCFGLFRGVILFPGDVYESADPRELEMILKHELAHIVRKDAWVNLYQRVIEAVFFFHPLIWYASLQLTQQREQICDNYVLAQGTSAADYTTLLAKTVEKALPGNRLGAVALMEGSLLSRIRFLLNPQRSTKTRLSAWTSLATALIFLIVSASSTVRLKAKVLGDSGPADYSTHYRIECKLDPTQGLLQGQEIIRFRNTTSQSLDQLKLAWISQGTLRITQQGRAVKFLSETDSGTGLRSLRVKLARAIEPGDEGRLLVKFRAKSSQFAKPDRLALPQWHPWIDRGRHTQSDFQVRLDVPSEYTLATSGVWHKKSGTYRAQGVRSFGLFLGQGLETLEATAGDVSVRCVFPPQGRACAELLLETAADAIGFYQDRWGFYPADSLTIIPGMNRPAGGYPVATNMVAIHGMQQFDTMPKLHWQWITAHEIGHQYFGEHVLCVEPTRSLDWLLIGLGIYADREYVRARNLGPAKHQALMERYIKGVRAGYDTTINRSPAQRRAVEFDFNNVVEHGKSYSVISALDCILGQGVFGRIYQRCLTEYAGRSLGVAEFQALCEDVAGQELTWFFDQWVKANRILSYKISKQVSEQKAGHYLSEIEVKCLGDLNMPIPVTASFRDGSTQTKFTDRHQAKQVIVFNSQSPLSAARLDAANQLALVVPPYQAPSRTEQDLNTRIHRLAWTGAGLQALEVYRDIRTDTTLNAGNWFKLALTLYDGQYYPEALKAFERTHALAETGSYRNPVSLVWCGHIHDLLGQRAQAVKCYESALAGGQAFQVRHDQYQLRIDRDWVQSRLTTPFTRPGQQEPATAANAENPLEILKVEMNPIRHGKNRLWAEVKNNTQQDQSYSIDIRTEGRANWQTQFLETVKGQKTKRTRFAFKINAPITTSTLIRLRFYRTDASGESQTKQWFKEMRYRGGDLAHYRLTPAQIQPASNAQMETASQTLQTVQALIKNQSYELAWKLFSQDFRQAELFAQGMDKYLKLAKLPRIYYLNNKEFLALEPRSLVRIGDVFALKVQTPGRILRKTRTVNFVIEAGQWKLDSIYPYDVTKEATSAPEPGLGLDQAGAVKQGFARFQTDIKNGRYASAWTFLSDHMQAGQHQNDFQEFQQRFSSDSLKSWVLSLQPTTVTRTEDFLTLNTEQGWRFHCVWEEGRWKLFQGQAPDRSNWKERLLPTLQKHSTQHFDIYCYKDSTAHREIEQIIKEKEAGFAEICRFLGQASDQRIEMIFFENGQTKQLVTGHQGAGWAVGNTIVEIYNEQQKLDPFHETAHVLMRPLGNPPALFNEGFAVYMSERLGARALRSLGGGESSIHQRVRGLKAGGEWISLEELMGYTEIGSSRSRPPVAYPEAASFVKYLIETHGRDKFLEAYKTLWNSSDPQMPQQNLKKLETIYGMSLAELKTQWHDAFQTSS